MKRHAGSILLSVTGFLMIGTALESQRYADFRQRQHLYQLILQTYQQAPPVQKNVQKNTKLRERHALVGANASIK